MFTARGRASKLLSIFLSVLIVFTGIVPVYGTEDEPSEFPVVIHANGGTFSDGSDTFSTTSWRGDPLAYCFDGGVSREGYQLIGLSSDKDGKNIVMSWDNETTDYWSNAYDYYVNEPLDFYAVWEKLNCITLDANGGYFSEDETKVTDYLRKGEEIGWYGEPSAKGKIFRYWATDKAGKNEFSEDNFGSYVPDGDLTLYAIWEKLNKITLDANGGYFSEDETKVTDYLRKGEEIGWYGEPSAKGKIFRYWTTDKAGKNEFSEDNFGSYVPDGDLTLYAIWDDAYTITFDANGGVFWGDNTTDTALIKKGERSDYWPSPELEGKKFIGYATDKAGKNMVFGETDSSEYTPTKDITLYAVWSDYYTVTLDANGGKFWGEDTTYSVEVVKGKSVNTWTDPENGEKLLVGWASDKAGKNLVIKPENTYYSSDDLANYVPTKDITLYAVWEDPIVVTFDGNGGYFSDDEANTTVKRSLYSGETIRWVNYPQAKGKIFQYWATDKAGKNEFTDEDFESYKVTKNMTLYAIWQDSYTITYDANGGYFWGDKERTTYTNEVVKGESLGWPSTPKLDGKAFKGWATDKAGKTEIDTEEYVPTKNMTIYAVWDDAYKITFDGNGGIYWDDNTTRISYIKKGDRIGSWESPELEGKLFKGYATDKAGKNMVFLESGYSDPYIPTKDTTLYAIWTDYFTITFDANGGYFSDDNHDGTSLTKKIAKDEVIGYQRSPKMSGKVFDGWATDKAGKNTISTDTYKATKNVTLYAVWDDAYTVTLDANGGKFWDNTKVATEEIKKGEAMENYAEPYLNDKVFKGYATDKAGKNIVVDARDPRADDYVPTKDITLYAVWLDYYNIIFDGNGGYFHEDKKMTSIASRVPRGERITYYEVPTAEGKVTSKWATDKAGKNVVDLETYIPSKDTTLYAVWDEAYVITLDGNGGLFDYYGESKTTKINVKKGERAEFRFRPELKSKLFKGYATDKAGKNPVYLEDEYLDYYPTKDTTLYAIWVDYYTVKFDANGGYWWGDKDKTVYSENFERGKNLERSYTPENGKKVLTAWATDKAGKNKVITWDYNYDELNHVEFHNAMEEYTPKGDTTLYAVWGDSNTVTFNANGGYFDMGRWSQNETEYRVTVPKGNAVRERIEVRRDGKTLAGWATDKAGKNKVITPDEKGTMYRALTAYVPSGDVTLYAVWVDAWTVTVDANGGYFDGDQKKTSLAVTVEKGTHLGSYFYNYPEKDGKAISAWALDKAGKNIIAKVEEDGSSDIYRYKPTKNTTIYAIWGDVWTVKLNANGGAFHKTGKSEIEISTLKGSRLDRSEGVSYKGKKLIGWATDKAGTKIVVPLPEEPVMYGERIPELYNYVPTKNTTLYAVWADLVTVTFDANGGEYSRGIRTATSSTGKGYALESVEVPSYDGKIIVGWATDKAGKNKVISVDAATENIYEARKAMLKYVPTKDITLYAVWKDGITVTLNANGGSFYNGITTSKVTVNKGESRTYYTNPQRDKMILVGWATDAAGKNKVMSWDYNYDDPNRVTEYDACDKYIPTKNVTLYAVWAASCTVTLDANGGYYPDYEHNRTKHYTEAVKGQCLLGVSIPVKKDKALVGWSTDKAGKNVVVKFEANDYPYSKTVRYKPSKDTTLYAVWGNVWNVTLDGNGGYFDIDDPTDVVQVGKGLAIVNTTNVPQRDGKLLVGWATDKAGKNVVRSWDAAAVPGNNAMFELQGYIPTKDTTLYAIWSDFYTVTFDANGGIFYEETSLQKYNMKVKKGATLTSWESPTFGKGIVRMQRGILPTMEGKRFLGWATDKAGKNKVFSVTWYKTGEYEISGSYKPTKNETLYAVWENEATAKTKAKIVKRLYGTGRYDTMEAIVNEGFGGTGGTVIVATGGGFKDALAAAGLAGLDNAPVVLTDSKTLSAQARRTLERLKPSKVYVAGGTFAISDKVFNDIKTLTKVTPDRLAGANSAETSAKLALAGKGKWSDKTAIIATNKSFKDALSVAPISYKKHYPILLADGGTKLTTPVLNALTSLGIKSVIIVGGKAAVTENVEKQLKSKGISIKIRLAGKNGVQTSEEIANWGIKNGMKSDYMGMATSQNYPDALAGAALCGVKGSVLVLADDKATANADYAKPYKKTQTRIYVFGGTFAVGTKTEGLIEASVM